MLAAAPAWVADLHTRWAWVVVIGNGLAGAWALGAYYTALLRHRALWWFTAAVELAVFGQVILGVATIQGRDLDGYRFHMFYGFLTVFSVAILYAYRTQLRPYLYLLYGGGGLFIMGLGIRAMVLHA